SLTSSLFPYTTLFRSWAVLLAAFVSAGETPTTRSVRSKEPRLASVTGSATRPGWNGRTLTDSVASVVVPLASTTCAFAPTPPVRSEEHTSELQSRVDL